MWFFGNRTVAPAESLRCARWAPPVVKEMLSNIYVAVEGTRNSFDLLMQSQRTLLDGVIFSDGHWADQNFAGVVEDTNEEELWRTLVPGIQTEDLQELLFVRPRMYCGVTVKHSVILVAPPLWRHRQ